MKYTILGMSMFSIAIGFFVLLFSMQTKAIKQEQLSVAVSQAMQNALETGMEEGYTPERCVDTFLDLLESELGDKGQVMAQIYYVDVEKGIFRVNVSLEFSYLAGRKNTVETERTLIYDGR